MTPRPPRPSEKPCDPNDPDSSCYHTPVSHGSGGYSRGRWGNWDGSGNCDPEDPNSSCYHSGSRVPAPVPVDVPEWREPIPEYVFPEEREECNPADLTLPCHHRQEDPNLRPAIPENPCGPNHPGPCWHTPIEDDTTNDTIDNP